MKKILSVSLGCLLFLIVNRSLSEKNTCSNFIDYFFLPFSRHCYKNPELFLTTPQILHRRQIPYENHTVTTKDGYVLSMMRMTSDKSKGVIVLTHCLTADSSIWFVGYRQSIALTLYNAGYEVWLPNLRGTALSSKHTNYRIPAKEYWDFSFHEIGLYDLPAILNYARQKTPGKKLIFMGHSLSSTSALVYASQKPLDAKKNVDLFVILCPTSFMKHSQTPGRYVALGLPFFRSIANKVGWYSVFKPFEPLLTVLRKIILSLPIEIPAALLCALSWGKATRPFQMDPDNFPMLLSVTPQGTSWKNFYHYGQLLTSRKFQMYDYGKNKNKEIYQAQKPFEYDLSTIEVSFYLVYGSYDTMADPEGMKQLYAQLPEITKTYGKLEIKGFNHGDFLYGRGRFTKVYDKIIQMLNRNIAAI